MKKCPFCAEEIQDEAIKCKHCGEFLSPLPAPPRPAEPPLPDSSAAVRAMEARERAKRPAHQRSGCLLPALVILTSLILAVTVPWVTIVVSGALVLASLVYLVKAESRPFLGRLFEGGDAKRSTARAVLVLLAAGFLLLFASSAAHLDRLRAKDGAKYQELLHAATRAHMKGDLDTAIRHLNEAEGVLHVDYEPRERGRRLLSEYLAEKETQQSKQYVFDADAALTAGRLEEAVRVLQQAVALPKAANRPHTSKMLDDCRKAASQEHVGDVLAAMAEADFNAYVKEGRLPEKTYFEDPRLNKAFAASLEARRGQAEELRAQGVKRQEAARRTEEEARKRAEEQAKAEAEAQVAAERNRRRQEQVLYARKADNIRSGPSTKYKVVRQTQADEQLMYEKKEGEWYKLDLDGEQEAWVHESVVRTEAQREALLHAKLVILDWHWGREYGFVKAEGQVLNVSDERLENVMAVVTFVTKDEEFVTTADGLIDFNPILPGQISPFKVLTTYNPAMETGYLEFKTIWGTKIPASRD